MNIPSDLTYIQPRATQVWNCDEIEFDTNGVRNKVICNYDFIQGEWTRMVKMESEHNSVARYLYLTKTMGNDSFHPSLCTKPRSNPKISTSILQWTGKYITHHMGIWIGMGFLNLQPNSTTYVVPPLSKIKQYFSMETTAILMTAYLCIWSAETFNPLSWKQGNLSTPSPMIMDQIPNLSLYTMRWSMCGCWSMVRKCFTSTNEIHLGGIMGQL